MLALSYDAEGAFPPARIIGEDVVVTDDPVRAYFNSIAGAGRIDAGREVLLAKRIEAGLYAQHKLTEAAELDTPLDFQLKRDLRLIAVEGERAKDEMILANQGLVINLAKRYQGRGLPFIDLIMEGNAGLTRAVYKFDYTKGYKFSTPTVWWIREAITRAIKEEARMIPLRRKDQKPANRVAGCIKAHVEKNGTEPSPEMIAKELRMDVGEVCDILLAMEDAVSLEQIVGEGRELGEFLSSREQTPLGPRIAAKWLLGFLSKRDAQILWERLAAGSARKAIGKEAGLSEAGVRTVEIRALAKLREIIEERGLTWQGVKKGRW